MNFHEDFYRCPACNSPYFKEDKLVIIDKEVYEVKKEVLITREIKKYTCNECGKELMVNELATR